MKAWGDKPGNEANEDLFIYLTTGGGCKICGSVEHLKANCPQGVKHRKTIKSEGTNNSVLDSLLHLHCMSDYMYPA